MAGKKKVKEIKEETIENVETKVDEVKETIYPDTKFILYSKEYSAEEVMNMVNKEKRESWENAVISKFKDLTSTYYKAIEFVTLNSCCNKVNSIAELKSKLDYNKILERCSRQNITFTKEMVDFIIKIKEEKII